MSAVPVTLVGNVATDVEPTKTATGKQFVRFRVATNERYRDQAGEWQSHDAVFWDCEAWNGRAEALAENFRKGSPVIVTGVMRSQSWKTDDGEARTRRYVKVEAFGPNLAAVKRETPAAQAESSEAAPAADDAADEWAAES